MANAYTVAEELDIPQKAEATKDKVRAEMLAQYLYRGIMGIPDENGKAPELDSVKVQASKILIDKGKPNLNAVEQTNIDGSETASQEELEAKLRALVSKANPALLSRILGEKAKELAHMGLADAKVGEDGQDKQSNAA